MVPRHNPFDLDLIAGWVRADPGMTAARLRASQSDLYVETRIVGRLRDLEVEALLPAVVALGRFDHDMLRLAFHGDEQSLTDAERRLASTEWIDVQRDEALGRTFLEVDRNLRPRLEAQYRRHHPGLLREAAHRLGPGLAALVDDPGRRRPLGRLGFEHVDAALRLLPPADAARLVDRLAMRVVEESGWGWAEGVAERLLAPGSPLADPGHPAAAGLRAMLASALHHLDQLRDLSELWRAVERHAPNHPDPEVARWLAQRAVLQLLVDPPGPEITEELGASIIGGPEEDPDREQRRQVLVGGLMGAFQRLLDRAEAGSRDWGELADPGAAIITVLEDVDQLAPGPGAAAGAFQRMLLRRAAQLRHSSLTGATVAFAGAVDDAAHAPLPPWLHADWEPPDDLRSRVLLEAVRVPHEALRDARGSDPLGFSGGLLGGVDAERLASAWLGWRLDREVVPAGEVERWERLPDLYEQRRPVCEAHRAVPAFFITLARAWTTLGRPQRALHVLREGHDAARKQRDSTVVTAAATARLEVVRRFRLAAEERSLRQQQLHARTLAERQRVWPLAVLVDPPEPVETLPRDAPDPDLHAWWRVQSATLGLDHAIEMLQQRGSGGTPSRSFPSLSLDLDLIELSRYRGLPAAMRTTYRIRVLREKLAPRLPIQFEQALRVDLRQHALEAGERPDLDRWVALLGPRRVAEVALDEGELLALRLPEPAQRLFSLAARRFGEAGDTVGGFIAKVMVALTEGEAEPVMVAGLKMAYEALPRDAGGEPLPPWPDLLGSRRTRTPVGHPEWGGWLPRLLVACARLNGAGEDEALALARDLGVRATELHDALRTRRVEHGRTAVPPPAAPVQATTPPAHAGQPPAPPREVGGDQENLAVVPVDVEADQSPAAPAGPPPAASSRRPSARRWPWRLVGAVVLLALATGIVFLPAPLGDSPGSQFEVGGPIGAIRLLVLVLAAAAAIVAAPAGRRLAVRLVTGLKRRLRPRPEVRALTIRAHPDAKAWFDLEGRVSWSAELPSFLPYRAQRVYVPTQLPPAVGLSVAPELASLPWEAVFLPLTRPPRRNEQRACWRELDPLPPVAGRRPAAPPMWRRNHGPCWAVAPMRWQPLLRENLSDVSVTSGELIDLSVAFRTLVVMGTPVETSAGTRLQVLEGRADPLLVEPDDATFHDYPLVVVLCEPSEGAVRVDAERELTADLRRCAAELAAAGAGSVLCLPSMPMELTGQVLAELDRRLRRVERGGWRELVSATEALRRRIEASVPGSPATSPAADKARELALEVTVFVRPDRAT